MAYGVKYKLVQKNNVSGTTITDKIEILQTDYSGGVTSIKGNAENGVFKHVYQNLDPEKLYDNPIQKSRIEIYLQVRGKGKDEVLQYDGLDILNQIFKADEDEFIVKRYLNSNHIWSGYVLPDLLSYPQGEYSYSGKIVAKDLTRLKHDVYESGNYGGFPTIIQGISDILNKLQLDLPIETITSWSEANIDNNTDFLNQIVFQTARLTDQNKSNEDALNEILRSEGLLLRQIGAKWQIIQLSGLKKPENTKVYQYDKNGNLQSSSTEDLSQDLDTERYLLKGSKNNVNPPLKSVTAKFESDEDLTAINLINNSVKADKNGNLRIPANGTLEEKQVYVGTFNQSKEDNNLKITFDIDAQAVDGDSFDFFRGYLRVFDGTNWLIKSGSEYLWQKNQTGKNNI
jgi:hypothetical protein